MGDIRRNWGLTVTEFTVHQARLWIAGAGDLVERQAMRLTELDTAIGDGDHGTNMLRGFAAVRKKLQVTVTEDFGSLFRLVGMTLISTVGGAAGPLYGGFFLEMAKVTAGKACLGKEEVSTVFAAGLNDVKRRGKAQVGDKTMVDSLEPAVAALESAKELCATFRAAADSAKTGAEATTPLEARKGRASYLGQRSIGHQDPGATSTWLLFEALASVCQQGMMVPEVDRHGRSGAGLS
jgi:phosphoenolpyruvate---glycerone phosphotransferase subunit DhaL